MPKYLLQASYTSEAWAAQIENQEDRITRIRPIIERLGGKLECAFYAFGECDIIAILDFPNNVNAAAWAIAGAASGGVRSVRTTPLLTMEEGIAAMQKAAVSGYEPPRS